MIATVHGVTAKPTQWPDLIGNKISEESGVGCFANANVLMHIQDACAIMSNV